MKWIYSVLVLVIVISCSNEKTSNKLLIDYMVDTSGPKIQYQFHKLNDHFSFIFKNEWERLSGDSYKLTALRMTKDSIPFLRSEEMYYGADSIVNEKVVSIKKIGGHLYEYPVQMLGKSLPCLVPNELTAMKSKSEMGEKTFYSYSLVKATFGEIDTLGIEISDGMQIANLDSTIEYYKDSVAVRKYRTVTFYEYKQGFHDLKMEFLSEDKYSEIEFKNQFD